MPEHNAPTFSNSVPLALEGWGGVIFVAPLASQSGRPLLAPTAPWPRRAAAPYAVAAGLAWQRLEARHAPRLGEYRVLRREASAAENATLVVRVREKGWQGGFPTT